jgi:ribosomal-protein-serine acetyltransferase
MFFTRTVDDEVALRIVEIHQAEMFYRLLHENRGHIAQWEEWVRNATFEGQLRYIETMREQFQRGLGFTAGIWYRTDPNEVHQMVGNLSYRVSPEIRSVELGYWLSRDHTGRGIVTRAVRNAIDYALVESGLNRVLIVTATANRASCAIPERLGFHLDGVLRDAAMVNGCYVDHAYYTMMASEWVHRAQGEQTSEV